MKMKHRCENRAGLGGSGGAAGWWWAGWEFRSCCLGLLDLGHQIPTVVMLLTLVTGLPEPTLKRNYLGPYGLL